MKLTLLEEAQCQFFDDNGYLVVPNALKTREVADLTAIGDRMVEEFRTEEREYYVQCRSGIVQERGFHSLLAHPATLPLVVQLLSANMALVRPGGDVLEQVDDIGKQLLGGSCDALVGWAAEQGIAPEAVEWTMPT